jgi:hypothetical protein
LHAQRVRLWQLYPRPTNRSAWLAEACADCWAAASGVPLSTVFDHSWLDATAQLQAKPLVTEVPAGSAAALDADSAGRAFFPAAGNVGGGAAARSLALYAAARSELGLVYGLAFQMAHPGSPPRGDAQGAQLVAELDDKVSAVMAALHLG